MHRIFHDFGRSVFLLGLMLGSTTKAIATDAQMPDSTTRYIGMDTAQVVSELGEPSLQTPHEIWYSNDTDITGGSPGAPNPTVALGRRGVVVGGAGGDYAPLASSHDLCHIVMTLDPHGLVTGVAKQGPGCFNFLHHLQRRTKPPAR